MNSCIDTINHFSGVWFNTVCVVVVQSVFVFALAAVATSLLRRFSASLRFWIWQAAALKLLLIPFSIVVVLPLWPAPPVQESVATPAAAMSSAFVDSVEPFVRDTQSVRTPAPATKSTSKFSGLAYAFSSWLLICSVQVVRCLRRKHRLSAFLKTCTPASEEHQLRLPQLAKKLGLRKSVGLMRGDVQVPLVTGVVAPTIILPSKQEFDRTMFDQVVLHELAHVKRHDLLWVWLPEVLRMLFFFHPITYWIRGQAKLQSEIACDELVLSSGSSRREYAQTLLQLASPASELDRFISRRALAPVRTG